MDGYAELAAVFGRLQVRSEADLDNLLRRIKSELPTKSNQIQRKAEREGL